MLSLQVRIEDLATQAKRERAFFKSPVHLGRNELNELILPEPYVSQWHALVRFDDKSIEYVDLGSTNGTVVDGKKLASGAALAVQPGTELRIGSLRVSLSLGQGEPEPEADRNRTQFRMRVSQVAMSPLLAAAAAAPAGAGVPPTGSAAPSFAPVPAPGSASGGPLAAGSLSGVSIPPGALSAASLSAASVAARASGPSRSTPPSPAAGLPLPGLPPPAPAGGADAGNIPVVPATPQDLFAAYVDYRKAYMRVHHGLMQRLNALSPDERKSEVNRLFSRFPALRFEQQFLDLLQSLSIPLPQGTPNPSRPSAPALQGQVPPTPTPSEWKRVPVAVEPKDGGPPGLGGLTGIVEEFARSYLPEPAALASRADAQKFLERLAEVLETFSKAFIELRKGQEQFGQETGVRIASENTPLTRAKSPGELVSYLIDWRGDEGRVGELMRGFADVMIHQVALLNGIKAGVRGLLARLSPDAVKDALQRAPVKAGAVPVPARWPFYSWTRWKRYVDLHRQFEEEEQAMSSVVFGREFARAYAVITGQGQAPGSEQGKGRS